ncbi:MAG TPA: T9SS type A sorting domain-containing protein [candidate division WOR-3 bacterium]|uniref:T9SS type A sorting domain-containing protein n=1 Tax=candidate division WOR-3 bacterium TaxID=2052148 RepID=A0A9C9JZ77_UNCW3|nr:T9SS type A sorting domain-containing protein [candidate division WOR-3 bacterium]
MYFIKWEVVIIIFVIHMGIAVTPPKVNLKPCAKIIGDEPITHSSVIPYLGGRSPGDQIGTTAYDYQASGSFGQRIMVDDYGQAHINWMWQDYPGQTMRYCAWNARFTNGSYYGETQASNSWSGYVQLDITRDANPDNQRTVIAYHYDAGSGFFSWIDIDGGNLWGTWPNNPTTPGVADYIWPYVCAANNGNIIMATGDYNAETHHLFLTTDEGASWTAIIDIDSCICLSQFLRASHNSDKVVFVNTSFITDSFVSGQLDNDVYYMLSTNGGATWGSRINVTNYQPSDTVRAFTDVNAIFDANDHLHIVWAGRMIINGNYYQASNIFHWDELSNTIVKVNSPSNYYTGEWWITSGTADPGAWRMPADRPQLIYDPTNPNDLYCLWLGNDDYSDTSANGYFNGEIYGAYSSDGGLTWTDYVNLTNTRTPGGASGACDDEDYMTAYPRVVNDSIFVTYIEDKDAGSLPHGEGVLTENPVRCWVFPTSMIGVEEQNTELPGATTIAITPNPVGRVGVLSYALARAGKINLRLYDASGRLVKSLAQGYQGAGSYTVRLSTAGLANGTYFVVLDTPFRRVSESLIIVH